MAKEFIVAPPTKEGTQNPDEGSDVSTTEKS